MKTQDEWNGITSLPYGIIMGHTWHEAGQILRVINDYDIDAFIEIGTNVGGLTSLLFGRTAVNHEFKYLGLELDFTIVNPHVLALRSLSPHFRILNLDCFSEEAFNEVGTHLRNSGRCLLYCDGGNKVKELYHFAPLLRGNDILMAHDYYDGTRDVRDVETPRAEVKPEDVEALVPLHHLTPIASYFERTRLIGWVK